MNLTRRFTWKKWAPDIGENRELIAAWTKTGQKGPSPGLYLELATGLTGLQMAELGARLRGVQDEVPYVAPEIPEGLSNSELAKLFEKTMGEHLERLRIALGNVLSPYVRVHGGPHTVDGEPLATLDDYLKLVEQGADRGVRARIDLDAAIGRFNGIEGPDELFLRRLSGGARSTDAQSVAREESPTESP